VEKSGEELNLLVHVVGRHLVHEREVRHDHVHHLNGDIHPRLARVWLYTRLRGQREWLVALPIGHRAEGGRGGEQVVQVRRPGAR